MTEQGHMALSVHVVFHHEIKSLLNKHRILELSATH